MKNQATFYTKIFMLALLASAVVHDKTFAQEGSALAPLESIEVDEEAIIAVQDDAMVLENVRGYLNSIKSLKAEFSQQGPDGRVANGTLHLERPGKVRFEYEGDVPLLIVSDGHTLNLIDYDIGQITKWPVDDTPLALLLAEDVKFNAGTSITNRVNEAGMDYLTVTSSNPENPSQGSLILIFTHPNDTDYELRAWQVIDAQGKLTTVSIANLTLNEGLNSQLWTFDDPRGESITRNRRR